MDIRTLQREMANWQIKNFPNALPHHPLLGIGEEVGELMHSHLKQEQGIRGTAEEHAAKKKDAIGDIYVFLNNYATLQGFDMEECIQLAWERVKKRDWKKDPTNGGETNV